jgi:hypothetical protein
MEDKITEGEMGKDKMTSEKIIAKMSVSRIIKKMIA